MKFSIALVGSIAALIAASPLEQGLAARSSSAAFFLDAQGELNTSATVVSYVKGSNSAYTGDIKYNWIDSEELLLTGGDSENSGLAFTSYHSTETGGTNLYIYPEDTKPIGFTRPHETGTLPDSARQWGFSRDRNDFLFFATQANWWACPLENNEATRSYQIYWKGKSGSLPCDDCKRVSLVAHSTCNKN